MRTTSLIKPILLLALFYVPLAVKQVETACSARGSPDRMECQIGDIWTDTTGHCSLPEKISATWSETMRVFDQVNRYYTDSFGLRNLFFNLYRDVKFNVFNISPWPDKVVRGDHGWLFLGNGFADCIKESKGIDTFDLRQLEIIRNNFQIFETWREQEGFAFYLAIAPEKSSANGGYLPIRKSSRPGKLDQVKGVLSDVGIELIDLKELFSANRGIRAFHMTDTHWNSYGAFLGYRALISRIRQDFPDVPEHQLHECQFDSGIWDQGDLSRMLTLRIPENWITMRPGFFVNGERKPDQFSVPGYFIGIVDDYEIRLENPGRSYSILIFRDSFFSNMSMFFASDFKEELLIWDQMSRDIIVKTKPDIVIYEVAEREIDIFTLLQY